MSVAEAHSASWSQPALQLSKEGCPVDPSKLSAFLCYLSRLNFILILSNYHFVLHLCASLLVRLYILFCDRDVIH